MASFLSCSPIQAGVSFAQGVLTGGSTCGIKASGKPDLGLLAFPAGSVTFGAFTRNAFAAAPVLVSQKHLSHSRLIRAIVVNSGNANACTGDQGLLDAQTMCSATAQALGLEAEQVLVCSTGIIGVPMPMDKLNNGIPALAQDLAPGAGDAFAAAIMTTDTGPKQVAFEVHTSAGVIKLGGCSKGAGMIHPNMATMLAFLTTDIALDDAFQSEFAQLVDDSFNSITVDGDTSTNDTVFLTATGASKIHYNELELEDKTAFRDALFAAFAELAKLIIRDGEGATKFVHVQVTGAASRDEARTFARYISNSKLVKTAMFGQDPNWGRILASLGSIGTHLNPADVSLSFDDVQIVQGGQPCPVDRDALLAVVRSPEYAVKINVGQGHGTSTAWTCDLSYEYVKINAEYST